jgi:serine/threonine-protein phosphatase PP1 catalytic subunit
MANWTSNVDNYARLLRDAAAAMRASPLRARSVVRLPRRGRLLATGDIHDNTMHLQAVVRAAELDASRDNHVVLHELIHGDRLVNDMDMSYRMLGRVAELVLAYPEQVHPILANHEIAQCRGQHISKGAGDNLALFNAGLDWVFGDDAGLAAEAISDFVRAMPLALRCDNGLFVSHSVPSPALAKYFDLRVLERDLCDEDLDGPHGAAYLMTWGRQQTAEHLEALAREWGVRTFIVGHAHAPVGVEVREPNMVILNTDHQQGRVVSIDLAADAPSANAVANASVAVVNYFDLEGLDLESPGAGS